eukprot:CAMPEP_0183522278 /NCGR_PEP_ID=MMETSP0371-20130417/18311_1 /TAXON_ID=268820 /ORGANISM="Peridinium aciculiferum, Strain PAER-2" /LENGTH=30 /DNA_ID= /DNA_START= /DNA_END= /DNA_ORIENTATION=
MTLGGLPMALGIPPTSSGVLPMPAGDTGST